MAPLATASAVITPASIRTSGVDAVAVEALLTACDRFNKSGDQQNYALCQANMGRLMRVKSRCRIEKNPNEISIEEENDLRQSIVHYQKAVDLVSNKTDLMPIYESLV